jgi:hypothetical protein
VGDVQFKTGSLIVSNFQIFYLFHRIY